MARYIVNGSPVEADADFIAAHYPGAQLDPTSEVLCSPVYPPPAWEWYIDLGPFYDRFGAKKPAVLASTNPAAVLALKDIAVRKWVDLKRQDVRDTVAGFVALTLITAAERDAILDTPVSHEENLALRKVFFS